MPSAGSGNSGGTSSAGRFTSHDSFGCPYRHKFSFSGISIIQIQKIRESIKIRDNGLTKKSNPFKHSYITKNWKESKLETETFPINQHTKWISILNVNFIRISSRTKCQIISTDRHLNQNLKLKLKFCPSPQFPINQFKEKQRKSNKFISRVVN